MSYAEGTSVPVERSRAEIERLISRYGSTEFISALMPGLAVIGFACKGRRVKFELSLPTPETARAALKKTARFRSNSAPEGAVQKWLENETRRLWRCLALAIKAKLEVVESGIATFDEEFLAHIVLKDDLTVYRAITQSVNGQRMLPPAAP